MCGGSYAGAEAGTQVPVWAQVCAGGGIGDEAWIRRAVCKYRSGRKFAQEAYRKMKPGFAGYAVFYHLYRFDTDF